MIATLAALAAFSGGSLIVDWTRAQIERLAELNGFEHGVWKHSQRRREWKWSATTGRLLLDAMLLYETKPSISERQLANPLMNALVGDKLFAARSLQWSVMAEEYPGQYSSCTSARFESRVIRGGIWIRISSQEASESDQITARRVSIHFAQLMATRFAAG